MKNIDKNKAIFAGVSVVLFYVLRNIVGSVTSILYFMFSSFGILYTIISIVLDIALFTVTFIAAYQITAKYIIKRPIAKQQDIIEMGVVASLASEAFYRLFVIFRVYGGGLQTLFCLAAMFVGFYLLDGEEVNNEELVVNQKTTLYRREKIVQKGSKAEGWLTNAFVFAWAAGAIFTWGGFIVQPRSQAPMFYAIGIAFLAMAFVWTRNKIENYNIESYKKIVLPADWPEDCSYDKYHLGLHAKVAKSSGGIFGDKNMKFYNECKSSGIKDLESDYNIQKATAVAQKQKIKEADLETLRMMFNKGKEMTENDAKASLEVGSENLLNDKRIEELNELAECMKYYGLHGMEKRKKMLKDLMKEANKNRKDAEMMQETARRTMLQKEHDWATHGGIASGIAGPAAGIATAIDIQAKNAAIREHNAKMMPYVGMVTSMYASNAEGYQQQYNKYAADYAATSTKLISNDSNEIVFDNIVIENAKYEVSKTGAVTVKAKFSVKDNYRIYDSVKPTIDGVVAARLMKDNECIGSAYFVFPVEGIITSRELSSICTKTIDPNANYTLKFEAVDVWAMEQL